MFITLVVSFLQSNDGVLDVSADLALNNGGDNDNIVSIGRESSACNPNEHLVVEHRLDKDDKNEQPIDSQSMSDQVQEEKVEAAATMEMAITVTPATFSDKAKTSTVAGCQDAINATVSTGKIELFLFHVNFVLI